MEHISVPMTHCIFEYGGADLYVDLAAEKIIAAEKEGRKIASEIITPQRDDQGENAGAAFRDAGSADFSASESAGKGLSEISEKERNDEKFYERMLIIAAGIGAGYGKTRILKSLPGYSGDIHSRLSNMYEGILQTLERSAAWAKLRSKGG